ncbi:DUF4439 domain-containing protein [Sphingomonas sp. CARO-RG-8B-R24-01]|uniref:DUF4439 domain-containing protein n=1 Tax=Sphingomonas sp. CARO-RG-8B-R24-01 TaxID=2914831 RepID=UPI001F5AC662|nr:DUF4439 domain-containing protein [Sphingomonas sp. CARO-RG-8B-R24-01]
MMDARSSTRIKEMTAMHTEDTATDRHTSDLDIIQSALVYEHEGIAAYRLAGASGLLTPDTLKAAGLFRGHHEAHRDQLASLVIETGGSPVEPKSDEQYVAELKLATLRTEADIVRLATELERGAATGYIGQIKGLRDRRLAHLFAQMSADEMTHWTTLNNAAGVALPAMAFQFG